MRSCVSVAPVEPNAYKFPLLARTEADLVVLFMDFTEGVVVHASEFSDRVGTYSKSFTHITRRDTWKILPNGSTVVLEQTNA